MLEAIRKIDASGEKHSEDYAIVMSLEIFVLIAQKQLNERDGTSGSSEITTQENKL